MENVIRLVGDLVGGAAGWVLRRVFEDDEPITRRRERRAAHDKANGETP